MKLIQERGALITGLITGLMVLLLTVIFLFLISPVRAEIRDYRAEYDLGEEILVKLKFEFKENNSEFAWIIPRDAKEVEVTGAGLDYEIYDLRDAKKAKIEGEFEQAEIRYLTNSLLEKTKDNFFILDLSEINAETRFIRVKLPEKATLKYSLEATQTAIIPKTEKIRTDGKRIIIEWEEEDLTGEAILIIYNLPRENNNRIIITSILILILIGSLFYYYQKKKTKKPKKPKKEREKELTRNLFKEEKKIVEELLKEKDNEIWQKQLQLKSGLSKVKLSRKLRSLEEKGLIKKIPYGNTNKIRLKKDEEKNKEK